MPTQTLHSVTQTKLLILFKVALEIISLAKHILNSCLTEVTLELEFEDLHGQEKKN